MVDGTHGVVMPERFFRTQRPGDAVCALGQRKRDAEYELYGVWADPAYDVSDFECEVTRIAEAAGESCSGVEKAIFAYRRLADLPWLRAVHDATRVLDVRRLIAVDAAIAELGPDLAGEILTALDEFAAAMFTPTKANQPLPTPKAITHRMRRFIATLDEQVGYNPADRKRRTRDNDAFAVHDFTAGTRSGVTIECDNATHAAIRQFRRQIARERKVSEEEATRLILTGRLTCDITVTLYGYAPLTPDKQVVAGAAMFFPGSGWTDSAAGAVLDDMTGGTPPRIIDLDSVADDEAAGYTPTAGMRAYATARDGVCIWPGCTTPAQHCQLNHREPYRDGGATVAGNLYSLCQTHHNAKTDRRAYYLVDPATGDVVWLFADGTYHLCEPEGFIGSQLGVSTPRWNTDVDTRRKKRDRMSTFFARGHALLDTYDTTHDYPACARALTELEEEYGMTFPYPPEPPTPPTPVVHHNAGLADECTEPLDHYEARIERLIANDPYLTHGNTIY